MTHAVREALVDLAGRATRGDLSSLAALHRSAPTRTDTFRQAAVLALLTPTPLEQAAATTAAHVRASRAPSAPATHQAAPSTRRPPPSTLRPAPSTHPVGADLFLVQRSPLLRHHPGQIALPGGGLEPADAGPEAAAVREAEEETGIAPARIEVLGSLATVPVPISSFMVTPVLGWADFVPPTGAVDQDEVLHTLRVSVDDLLAPDARATVVHGEHTSPGFRTAAGWIWGFTGLLLDHLFTQLDWTRPWDTGSRYTMSWDEAHGGQLLGHVTSPD